MDKVLKKIQKIANEGVLVKIVDSIDEKTQKPTNIEYIYTFGVKSMSITLTHKVDKDYKTLYFSVVAGIISPVDNTLLAKSEVFKFYSSKEITARIMALITPVLSKNKEKTKKETKGASIVSKPQQNNTKENINVFYR